MLMNLTLNIILIVLGIMEIAFGFNMEKFIRAKYKDINVHNMDGLIRWEKCTSILTGALILIFALIGFMGLYNKYGGGFIIILLVIRISTIAGRRKYIDGL